MSRLDSFTRLALDFKDGAVINAINGNTYVNNGFLEDLNNEYFVGSPSFRASLGTSVITIPSTDLALSNMDFTIEFFIKGSLSSFGNILSNGSSNSSIIISTNANGLNTGSSVNGEIHVFPVGLNSGSIVLDNSWHHIAICRGGNNFRLYVDGILKDSSTSTLTFNTTNFTLGNGYRPAFMGNITDFSVSIGIARYTSNFPIPNVATIDKASLKLLNLDSNYYYYDVSWKILTNPLTSAQILEFGMKSITKEQISNFEFLYGNQWNLILWSRNRTLNKTNIEAIPPSQILTAKNSIQLTGVESATFKWSATGGSRVALSIDDGVTYYAFKNNSWTDVTNNMSNAMTATEYSALTWEQYSLLKGESNFLKHQYYIPDNSTVDDILITAELMGENKLSSDYTLSYDQSSKTIQIQIKKSGSFFANYIDV